MLEDFLEANGLNAKIARGIKRNNLVRCVLFASPKEFFLLVFSAEKKIDRQKLCAVLKAEKVKPVHGQKVEEITGYEESFLPPVSIFGIKVIIDSEIMGKKPVHCLVAEDKTLEIFPQEIVSANEKALIAEL